MSTVNANSFKDASGGSNAVLHGVASPPNSMGFRNRIINGDMRIDQRNAGASVTANTGVNYTLDRWGCFFSQTSKFRIQQNSSSVTPPAGFTNYLGITSLSAYTNTSTDYNFIIQSLEGFNIADFGWGSAGAQSVTLSFWIRSSLTGTFSGSFRNGTTPVRSYVFTYTVNAANTWEFKTITIPGDTSGTWLVNNNSGIGLSFCIGSGSTRLGTAGSWQAADFDGVTGTTSVVGTNGATFYITGVQLEAGSVASPFERRDYGRELIMCQRYYSQIENRWFTGYSTDTSNQINGSPIPVSMRTAPTIGLFGSDSNTNVGSLITTDVTTQNINFVTQSLAAGWWRIRIFKITLTSEF